MLIKFTVCVFYFLDFTTYISIVSTIVYAFSYVFDIKQADGSPDRKRQPLSTYTQDAMCIAEWRDGNAS